MYFIAASFHVGTIKCLIAHSTCSIILLLITGKMKFPPIYYWYTVWNKSTSFNYLACIQHQLR